MSIQADDPTATARNYLTHLRRYRDDLRRAREEADLRMQDAMIFAACDGMPLRDICFYSGYETTTVQSILTRRGAI